jgi:hypothetical protein
MILSSILRPSRRWAENAGVEYIPERKDPQSKRGQKQPYTDAVNIAIRKEKGLRLRMYRIDSPQHCGTCLFRMPPI